jgi:molybdopterin-guanine dinucleotide biosynthesis protein B
MALVKPAILQIVGYQNSGKTTMIIKLIEALSGLGFKTVTIKHHGHGGKPADVEQKDSTRHLSAGAAASIVEGGGSLILQADSISFTLDEQIKLLCLSINPDVILIEGHKQANYPKLLMVRDPEDLSLLHQVSNVQAVIYWNKAVKECLTTVNIPCFAMEDAELIHECVGLLKLSK